ncbi:MAG TPA: tyrosine-protein phosphatase [Solirubrobacteraceae bacterium]|jgi:protein-tyrosine phosphatase|nr:tyrosine-protein phosphatase [Solirubrobacteraceae bacterium]
MSATGRAILVDGLRNLRDVGGLPAGPGRVTRRGVLRSEATANATRESLGWARAGHDRSCPASGIDLRARGLAGSVSAPVPDGVRHHSIVLQPPADGSGNGLIEQVMAGELLDYSVGELGALNTAMLDTPCAAPPWPGQASEPAPAFGTAIEHLADPANLPCLVHCHAGKDRTGLVACAPNGVSPSPSSWPASAARRSSTTTSARPSIAATAAARSSPP